MIKTEVTSITINKNVKKAAKKYAVKNFTNLSQIICQALIKFLQGEGIDIQPGHDRNK